MKFLAALSVLFVSLFFAGCTQLEVLAYRTVIGANAFTRSILDKHPECVANATQAQAKTPLCDDLARAIAAKNALIDASEVYCAGPDFDSGGACNPPKKGTPGYDQAAAKLKAAINLYDLAASDLKGVIH